MEGLKARHDLCIFIRVKQTVVAIVINYVGLLSEVSFLCQTIATVYPGYCRS